MLGIILLLLIIPVIAFAAVLLLIHLGFANETIRKQVEKSASSSLKVPVTCQKLEILLTQQKLIVEGLIISNPKRKEKEREREGEREGGGYKTPHLLRINHIDVQLDLAKLLSKEIRLVSAHVLSSDINFEGGISENNLTTFLDHLKPKKKKKEEKARTRDLDFDQSSSRDVSSDSQKPEAPVHFVADDIVFNDTGVTFTLTDLPDFVRSKTDGVRLPVPEVKTSVGGDPDHAGREVMHNFVGSASDSVIDHLKGHLTSLPSDIISSVVDGGVISAVSDSVHVSDIVSDVAENVDVGNVVGAVSSFFN